MVLQRRNDNVWVSVRRTFRWLASLIVVALCAWVGGQFYRPSGYDVLLAEKERIERERQQLQQIVERLTVERRVAEVEVLERRTGEDGQSQTLIRFVEFDRQDKPLPESRFTVPGSVVFFDALVIKFAEDRVAAGDPLRGRSIALFRRVYSETQAPVEGQPIDTSGDVPNIYRIAPCPTVFEQRLWSEFWSYATDRAKAHAEGVRVAQGEAVYAPLAPGEKWTLTLEDDGGLNLVKRQSVTEQPSDILATGMTAEPDR